jgi:hypothetical protein
MQFPRDALALGQTFGKTGMHLLDGVPHPCPEREPGKPRNGLGAERAEPPGLVDCRRPFDLQGHRKVAPVFAIARGNLKPVTSGTQPRVESLPSAAGILPVLVLFFLFSITYV